MWRLIKWLVKFLVVLFIMFVVVWYSMKFYFSHINRISDRVRHDVFVQVQEQHSRYIAYTDIPKPYRDAAIATEDRNFFTNVGIDFRGIVRAIFVDLGGNGTPQGGSTITQQLIHNTVLSDIPKSIQWKLTESVYAIGLYDTMSKQDTFALYANDIYFGHGAYGLYQAAHTYFGRSPSALNAGELTMLAGLPNAPSVYDPYRNFGLARQRQKWVIQCMVAAKMISLSEANQIANEPIRLR